MKLPFQALPFRLKFPFFRFNASLFHSDPPVRMQVFGFKSSIFRVKFFRFKPSVSNIPLPFQTLSLFSSIPGVQGLHGYRFIGWTLGLSVYRVKREIQTGVASSMRCYVKIYYILYFIWYVISYYSLIFII